MRVLWTILGGVLIAATVAAAVPRPWQKRIGRNIPVRHKLAHQNVKPEMWPDEPLSPDRIDTERLRSAFSILCGPMPEKRLDRYVTTLLEEGARFDVDPFLLAALVYDQSGCRPRTPDRETRKGITRIDLDMHAPHIRGGEYRYYLKNGTDWKRHVLKMNKYPFNKWKAEKIVSNLYLSSAIIKVLSLQCSDLDKAFKSVPHRHPISHWFYGDRVREAEPEDRVLTARRRLLAYYNDAVPESANTFNGVPIVSPMDGVPRLVIDYFGNRRGKKRGRGHRGIDIVGTAGEPVRSIADGRVAFSGVDLPGGGKSRQLRPEEAAAIPNREMGAGGLYVAINHGEGLGSIYMHLESLAMRQGADVKAGQIIGTVGRSGTVSSGPHLHLELRVGTDRIDPAKPFADVLINPFL
ncbi:MAG: M23 family metallopeptidase [Deltaproteobacteria bacterium]|nr:M23 family metallopeptidase [Deltaproteobacteria bacterium]